MYSANSASFLAIIQRAKPRQEAKPKPNVKNMRQASSVSVNVFSVIALLFHAAQPPTEPDGGDYDGGFYYGQNYSGPNLV